jgi:hypothetical protein
VKACESCGDLLKPGKLLFCSQSCERIGPPVSAFQSRAFAVLKEKPDGFYTAEDMHFAMGGSRSHNLLSISKELRRPRGMLSIQDGKIKLRPGYDVTFVARVAAREDARKKKRTPIAKLKQSAIVDRKEIRTLRSIAGSLEIATIDSKRGRSVCSIEPAAFSRGDFVVREITINGETWGVWLQLLDERPNPPPTEPAF